jgi:trans-AT polyketide synthase, acyltransferase and oxidoreductase domains
MIITAQSLGDDQFRADYGLCYAYLAGSMYKAITSQALVVAMGRAGLLGYFGTGGLKLEEIETAIHSIKGELRAGQAYGMNLLRDPFHRDLEAKCVALFLQNQVRYVEASAFTQVTPSVVHYRLKGITRTPDGEPRVPNRLLAKISRPEVAAAFMRPPPAPIVAKLVEAGALSAEEARLGASVSVASEICVEADSGGHTDQGSALALLPAIVALRDEYQLTSGCVNRVSVGAAGGIGTPQAAAAAFVLGADFIMTGSINQCTVEAGTSDSVKDLLQHLDVRDTTYAPAGDLFEIGSQVQVVRRGLFFPARARRLFELYQRHDCIEDLDATTRKQLQEDYFRRSLEDVWSETKAHLAARSSADEIEALERNGKRKMALIFKWYFAYSARLALQGCEARRTDYQVHCGPALGAFNRWVAGTALQSWRGRRVADIAARIMTGAAEVLTTRFRQPQCVEVSSTTFRRACV